MGRNARAEVWSREDAREEQAQVAQTPVHGGAAGLGHRVEQ